MATSKINGGKVEGEATLAQDYLGAFHTFSLTYQADVVDVKEYDLIVVGTGSAMNVLDALIQKNPNVKIAVIDKDEPGGICLTRGCIPSKILLYPADW